MDGLLYPASIVEINEDRASCRVRYLYYENEEEQPLRALLPFSVYKPAVGANMPTEGSSAVLSNNPRDPTNPINPINPIDPTNSLDPNGLTGHSPSLTCPVKSTGAPLVDSGNPAPAAAPAQGNQQCMKAGQQCVHGGHAAPMLANASPAQSNHPDAACSSLPQCANSVHRDPFAFFTQVSPRSFSSSYT